MVKSKTKRKLVEEKVTTNGKDKQELEETAEAESDYESDQVNNFFCNMCFYLPP
jgi:hypothetical protein